MTPPARLAAAIDVLEAILGGELAERALTRWARASRFAGSKDRAAVRDIVFDCLRQRRSLGYLGGGDTGRGLALGLLRAEGRDPRPLFTGQGYGPAPLTDDERGSGLGNLDDAPLAVRLDVPDALADELAADLGGTYEAIMSAMRARAPVDLRVNALKADRDEVSAALAKEGIEARPHGLAPHALRVVANQRLVAQSRCYRQGLVELQDVSSQAVAEAAGARPGMVVLDYCAGGGGKSLAFAAGMENRGLLMAHDANPGRMKDLPARAGRAGARIEVLQPGAIARVPRCDLVFVDAPCSGTGAWRRNPESKWRLTLADLARLTALQDGILDEAASRVRPGGLLVYATCSLLERENGGRVAAFLGRQEGWAAVERRTFTPLDGGDGFFIARLRAPA